MPASFEGRALLVILLAVLVMPLSGCGGKSTKEWIGQLQSKDASERLHAVKALAKRSGDAKAVTPALADALKDKDAFVRRDAAEALGELGAKAKPAVPALLVAARDRNPEVRRKAVKALQQIDPQAAASAGVQ